MLLPPHIRDIGFVQSLVHPSAAQVMNAGGGTQVARPAAPWGYTNTWGNNFCLLVVWLVVACWPLARSHRARWLGAACLVVAILPVVHSLNRGLWIGLAVTGAYVVFRLVRLGRVGAVGAVVAGVLGLAIALQVTPLGTMVGDRIDNARSNGVRMYLVDRALAGLAESPLIGFGSTRDTMGSRNSIAVGERSNCKRCGNFTVGGNGQLWQLLYAHGILGAIAYIGFLLHGLWRFRRDRSPIGIAGSAALVASFSAMLWYNSLVTPLALLFLGYALLWRNELSRSSLPAVTR
jgi:O-antigen ligase